MKTPGFRLLSKLASGLVLAAASFSFVGCTFLGIDKNAARNDVPASTLHRAARELDAESRALDATLTALDSLVNHPAENLKPQFDRFSRALDRLAEVANRNDDEVNRVNRRGNSYFADWDRDLANINYGVIREQSVSRKNLVSEEFNTLNRRYRETQAVVEPLIAYLEDIRTALESDLTEGGLAAVRDVTANAQESGRKVQNALTEVADDLAESSVRLSSVARQPREARGMGAAESPAGSTNRAEISK